MKTTATKWPVTLTLEVADDFLEGINEKNAESFKAGMNSIQDQVEEWARAFMAIKAMLIAQQEFESKNPNSPE